MPSLENFIFSRCFSHYLYFKSSISISLPSHLRDSDIYIYLLCSRYSTEILKATRPELSPGSSPWTTHTLNFLFYICWFLFIKTPWFRLGIMLNSSLSIWPISIQCSGSISHSGWAPYWVSLHHCPNPGPEQRLVCLLASCLTSIQSIFLTVSGAVSYTGI